MSLFGGDKKVQCRWHQQISHKQTVRSVKYLQHT